MESMANKESRTTRTLALMKTTDFASGKAANTVNTIDGNDELMAAAAAGEEDYNRLCV